jgi:hypothetical protein
MNEEQQRLARIEDLLTRNLEVAEETKNILKEMRRNSLIAFWFKVVLWAAVLILPLLFIKPLLNSIFPVTKGETGVNVSTFPTQEDIQKALELYTQGQ